MNQHFYKPNPRNTGCAVSFGSNDNKSLYVSFVKQVSWNDEKKTGSFRENVKDPEKSINVKFTNVEAGGILNAIHTKSEYKIYHTSPKGVTTGSFKPYIVKDENNKEVDKGYSFSIFKQGNKNLFAVGFTHAEAEVLVIFLREYILSTFFAKEVEVTKTQPVAKVAAKAPVKTPVKPSAAAKPVVEEAVVEEVVEEVEF